MLKLSIIIPTLNRPDDLEKTLEWLLMQDFKSFQVILVDQSDNDKSEYISNIYKNKWLDINYYRFMTKSWAQARNYAIDKIDYFDNLSGRKTDVVSFLDDDVSFDKDFLTNLGIYISDNPWVIWWTWKIKSPTREVWLGKKLWIFLLWWWRWVNQQVVTKTWFNQMFTNQPKTEQSVERTSGCGMRYRKSVFEIWYRFPEHFLKYSIMEDLFLSYGIYKAINGDNIYIDQKNTLTSRAFDLTNFWPYGPYKLSYTPSVEMTHHESPNRSIPNYQKIRQHCIHRYIFHKTFWISMIGYIWTILLIMKLDLLTFRKISIIWEYLKSLIYIYQNKKNLNLDNWDYNKFIFDL